MEKIKSRQSNFELLRIVAMLMIVLNHFAHHGGFEFDSTHITIPQLWWNALNTGGNLGVDLFVLISGYFLIKDSNVSLKDNMQKLLKFWGQVFFFSIILYIASLCIYGWGG